MGHAADVYAVAVYPDGRTVASASRDNTLKVWSIESGCVLRTLETSSDFVYCAAIKRRCKTRLSSSLQTTH